MISTQQLREDFKNSLSQWESEVDHQKADRQIYTEIQHWRLHIEHFIEKKIALLNTDFNEYNLQGEYLRSVTESFSDLEQLMRQHQTFEAIPQGATPRLMISKIKRYHTHYLIPLFNIIAKLENDYTAIAKKSMIAKSKMIAELDSDIKRLSAEKKSIKNQLFAFNKKEKLIEVLKKIQALEMKRKIMRLTLHHDKLNLYYFNHERPPELKEIKEKAEQLRMALTEATEVDHEPQ